MQQTGTVLGISMFTTQTVSTIQIFDKQLQVFTWSMTQLTITNHIT